MPSSSLLATAAVAAVCAARGDAAPLWTNVSGPAPTLHVARSGHSSFTFTNGGVSTIVIQGGCSSSCCYAPLADAAAWTASAGWTAVTQIGGAAPGPRLYAATAPVNATAALLIGGTNIQGFFNDTVLAVYDAASASITWSAIATVGYSGGVAPRAGHAVLALSTTQYILYGGANDAGPMGDSWLLMLSDDLRTGSWSQLTSPGGPGPRTQHAMTVTLATEVWPDGAVIVVGGSDAAGVDHADVWAGDIATHKWTQLASDAAAPAPRHSHSVWMQSHDTMIMYGGQSGTPSTAPFVGDVWSMNVTSPSPVWTLISNGTVDPSPAAPNARSQFTTVQLPDGHIYVACGFSGYAGGLNDMFHDDVWQFGTPVTA